MEIEDLRMNPGTQGFGSVDASAPDQFMEIWIMDGD